MAKDFVKRSKPRKKKPPPKRFSLGSYMAGVMTGVGLFLLGAYGPELLGIDDPQKPQPAQQTTQTEAFPTEVFHTEVFHTEANPDKPQGDAQAQKVEALAAESVTQDLKFEFRDLLGTDRVEPDVSVYEAGGVGRQYQQSNAQTGPIRYLLQSGSFQIKADAESRRGSLLLLNMPATIVEAKLENKIWYRVIVGPYNQRVEAQQAAIRMRAQKIESIWMEQPVTAG